MQQNIQATHNNAEVSFGSAIGRCAYNEETRSRKVVVLSRGLIRVGQSIKRQSRSLDVGHDTESSDPCRAQSSLTILLTFAVHH